MNAVLKTHLAGSPSDITRDLRDNIDVDNLVSGSSNDHEALKYYKHSVEILSRGGFNLRSWATNSKTLKQTFLLDGKQDPSPTVGVLGVTWDTEEDVLGFKQDQVPTAEEVTKREVVKKTSLLFDPLGLLSPVHVQAKIFIQKLWQSKLHWDEPLDEELKLEWSGIQNDLEAAKDIKFKRPYFMSQDMSQEYEIHAFADASSKAYGAALYLKQGTQCTLMIAKARVKPLKEVTLPRLELLASFVAAKLSQFVVKALHGLRIGRMVLWCDSQIVLYWIHSKKKLPRFVSNRVRAIREANFTDIRYCPTEDNPADLTTRGISIEKLKSSKLWMNGPAWLPEGNWPICNLYDDKVLACQAEVEYTDAESQKDSNEGSSNMKHGLDGVIDIKKFGTLEKLLRVTTYVLRFIRALQKKRHTQEFISVSELKEARNLWIKSIQTNSYKKELHDIARGNRNSLVHQLKLFVGEDGNLRCGGRLHNACLKYDNKFPFLIPKRHHFTNLVVRWAHRHLLHAGETCTISFIRHVYWIPQIRQVVKGILRSCVTCRKVQGRPFRMPETPPLPKCRLEEAPPFTVCGVDFTGALVYRNNNNYTMNKAYICLFTCAVTRAVHLEVVTDMTSRTFIQAFRRFAARRSLPSVMVSDNGSTFLAASEEIKNICDYLSHRHVKWTFIPKRAPWFGGFYERLIGVTKTSLKKTLGKQLVSLDELITLITELEAVINDRPISYTSTGLDEPEALTPSMLLHGRKLCPLPQLDITDEEVEDPDFGSEVLQQRVKELSNLFIQTWKRWKEEYLPMLREVHKNNAKGCRGETENHIKVGDVVLVHEDTTKRVQWPLALVTKLRTGNDGLVRSAEIKMKGGTSNRPITKLYPLEVRSNISETDADIQTEVSDVVPLLNVRPVRRAAAEARTVIKQWVDQLS